MDCQHDHEKDIARKEERLMDKPDTPFPRHWLYYIILKYAVIAVAVLLAAYVLYSLQ
jgi:hypothetical protein